MSFPSFSSLLASLGGAKCVLDQPVPPVSTTKPIVDGKPEMFDAISVIHCPKVKLELKDDQIYLFGKKCERTNTDNYLVDVELACYEGYRVYLTSIWEVVEEKRDRIQSEVINSPPKMPVIRAETYQGELNSRKCKLSQKVLEPKSKPKGEIVCLHMKCKKALDSYEWWEGKFFFKFA